MFRKAAIAIAIVFMFSVTTQGEKKSRSRASREITEKRIRRGTRSRPAVRRSRPPAHRGLVHRRHYSPGYGRGHRSGYFHRDRVRRYHQHHYPRRWVSPVYGYREVEVWVPPVYRTVHSGREGRRVLIREGCYEIRRVRYVVCEGYWRTLPCSCGRVSIGIRIGF